MDLLRGIWFLFVLTVTLWRQTALDRLHPDPRSSGGIFPGLRGATPWRTLRRIVIPLLIPGIISGWIFMATMFVRELTLSVVLSQPGSEVLAVQILRFAEDGLWGRLSALGILMIFISSALVIAASLLGRRLTRMQMTAGPR
jgi:ABC-type glycerol-3-phosphate transport system permease component